MDKNLASYIWKHTSRQQIWILFIILLSMPTYFLSLDLPKQIVNGPIQGDGFDTPGATQTFLQPRLRPAGLVGHVEPFFRGLQLNRFKMLMALCRCFLALVIVNGLFKFYINTFKGRLGERMLRRLRFELIDRVLRFPPNVFKRVKSAEIATMVKDEVEPMGGFIGDAFVQPAFLGGQAATALVLHHPRRISGSACSPPSWSASRVVIPQHAQAPAQARQGAPAHRAPARRARRRNRRRHLLDPRQ